MTLLDMPIGKPFLVYDGVRMYETIRIDELHFGGTELESGGLSENTDMGLNQAWANYLKIVDYFEDVVPAKCECGAESIGVSAHSHWCQKASAA